MILSLILNSIDVVLAFYLSVLFIWWWTKFHRATNVYKATCVLMAGICFQSASLAWSMFRKLFYREDLDDIVASWYTVPSKIIITLSLIWYCCYFTKKALKGNFGRRADDL
jgi:hypothetical protein